MGSVSDLARAVREFDPIRSARCWWEYWNSSTQRRVRYLSGFWPTVGLLGVYVVVMVGVMVWYVGAVR